MPDAAITALLIEGSITALFLLALLALRAADVVTYLRERRRDKRALLYQRAINTRHGADPDLEPRHSSNTAYEWDAVRLPRDRKLALIAAGFTPDQARAGHGNDLDNEALTVIAALNPTSTLQDRF